MPYNFKGLTGMGQSQSRGKKSFLNFAKCIKSRLVSTGVSPAECPLNV